MIPFSPRSSRDVSQDEVWKQGPVYTASNKPLARLVARPVREFLRIEAAGSIMLLVAAALALIWANSPLSEAYFDLWHTTIGFEIGSFGIEEDLQHWVNDALMVIFFFVVGLEIKYELVRGDLRDPKTAALPIIAAVGGMAVPALLYLAIAGGGDTGSGWGIPMATDIAFAVGVLGVLGRRIPSAARLFLLTLAIVDDIGAIIVIAVFYTEDLDLRWLAVAVGLLLVMVLMRVLRIWKISAYVVIGFAAWFATLESGVHATLAGVAIGLLTPAYALLNEGVAREYARNAIADKSLDPDELDRLRFLLEESVPIVERLQNRLHPVSAYLVLPVFALANAGVDLRGGCPGRGDHLRRRARRRCRPGHRQARRHPARLVHRRPLRSRPAARPHVVGSDRRHRLDRRHRVHGVAVHRAAVLPGVRDPHPGRQGGHHPGLGAGRPRRPRLPAAHPRVPTGRPRRRRGPRGRRVRPGLLGRRCGERPPGGRARPGVDGSLRLSARPAGRNARPHGGGQAT